VSLDTQERVRRAALAFADELIAALDELQAPILTARKATGASALKRPGSAT
jgi:hypothetical protein